MKYLFGTMAFLGASVIMADSTDNKADAHRLVLYEKLTQKYSFLVYQDKNDKHILVPGGAFLLRRTAKPGVDDARKHCNTCIYLEYLRRAQAKASSIEIKPIALVDTDDGKQIPGDEYYAQHCPQDVYQNLPDYIIDDFRTADAHTQNQINKRAQ
jgi:hypothetical protein